MESAYDSAEDYRDEDCPTEVEAEIEALREEFERVRCLFFTYLDPPPD
jgi:hypothetical protein